MLYDDKKDVPVCHQILFQKNNVHSPLNYTRLHYPVLLACPCLHCSIHPGATPLQANHNRVYVKTWLRLTFVWERLDVMRKWLRGEGERRKRWWRLYVWIWRRMWRGRRRKSSQSLWCGLSIPGYICWERCRFRDMMMAQLKRNNVPVLFFFCQAGPVILFRSGEIGELRI